MLKTPLTYILLLWLPFSFCSCHVLKLLHHIFFGFPLDLLPPGSSKLTSFKNDPILSPILSYMRLFDLASSTATILIHWYISLCLIPFSYIFSSLFIFKGWPKLFLILFSNYLKIFFILYLSTSIIFYLRNMNINESGFTLNCVLRILRVQMPAPRMWSVETTQLVCGLKTPSVRNVSATLAMSSTTKSA